VLRPVAPDIQRAIQESVAAGMTYRDASLKFNVSLRTVARYARDYQRRQNEATVCGLTELQLKVVCQVAYGLSNKEIAQQLDISTPTIRNQIHLSMKKLKLIRRSQLVIFAHQLRLVCLDDVILFGDEEDEQDE
jgi:DNA-binding CsgD family transcriptional regulator